MNADLSSMAQSVPGQQQDDPVECWLMNLLEMDCSRSIVPSDFEDTHSNSIEWSLWEDTLAWSPVNIFDMHQHWSTTLLTGVVSSWAIPNNLMDYSSNRIEWSPLFLAEQYHDDVSRWQGYLINPLTIGVHWDDVTKECKKGNDGNSSDSVPVEDRGPNNVHDGLFFALAYLDTQDLLAVEMVCKDLRDAVRSDPLLWRCIHLYFPLSWKTTDDNLLQLTQRAHGMLRCLNIQTCSRVTVNGLRRVLESNPRMEKLSIPGTIMQIDGIIRNLKAFKSSGNDGIKQLRLGLFRTVTLEQLKELNTLLDIDKIQQQKPRKSHFFPSFWSVLDCTFDHAFDYEVCPMCKEVEIVYDCPLASCQSKTSQKCRACFRCIQRCSNCGKCQRDQLGGYLNGNYDHQIGSFFEDNLCLDCWKALGSRLWSNQE